MLDMKGLQRIALFGARHCLQAELMNYRVESFQVGEDVDPVNVPPLRIVVSHPTAMDQAMEFVVQCTAGPEPLDGSRLRELLLLALCTDHGHLDRPGSLACRTCNRRVDVIFETLAGAGYEIVAGR